MLKSFGIPILALATLAPGAAFSAPSSSTTYTYHHRERHPVRKTVKRVGIGAAGGAAVGALMGGGAGAAIGAVAGGGAGAIYDHHEKKIGK